MVLIVALALAMDVFAVSLGAATSGHASTARPVFRLSFHFGLFQGLMTVIGWLAGSAVAPLIAAMDHWLAMVLLTIVGLRMIRSGWIGEAKAAGPDPSRGGMLVMLSLATSVDALAVGLSLAMLQAGVLQSAVVIGLVSSGLSVLGVVIGNRLGQRFGGVMEIVGGLILIGIGLRVVLTHST
jgi:putative Mn2+ efflux pump MntP